MTIDDKTPHLALPLPHPDNGLEEDVLRLRAALSSLDSKIAALDTLLSSDDITLDSVQELVGAIKAASTEIDAVNAVVASQLSAQNTAINTQLTVQNEAVAQQLATISALAYAGL